MTHDRCWFTVLTVGLLSSVGLTLAAGQTATEPPRFRVGVDAVRIDAVVTDKDGKLVTDLTADDFDVHQDGRPQKITLVRWVPTARPHATTTAPASGAPSATPAPSPRLAPGEVQRTIMIVVDDLGTSFESYPPAREALHRFIDEELGPNDLVAVVRTGGAGNALQQFTSDRQALHRAIDALEWNWQSRNGVEPLAAIQQQGSLSFGGQTYRMPGFADLDALRASMQATNTFSALALLIRSARELPGRKAMILVSEGMRMVDRYDGPGGESGHGVLPDIRIVLPRDHVEDQAVRAGVVIYALDPRGLQSGRLLASDDLGATNSASTVLSAAADRHQYLLDTQDSLAHISETTGGFAVLNTNDLASGLKRITDDQRGYYLIGYVPDDGTFAKPGKTIQYHRFSVEVKRRGLNVRTHTGFLGVSDENHRSAPTSGGELLLAAALSPFAAAGVPMALAADASDANGTLSVVSHLRADAIGDEGADVLGLVLDASGDVVARGTSTLSRGPHQFDATMQVPKPGTYQVRFAIRDRRTSAVGSDAEFVTVPDHVHATATDAPQ